MEDVYPIPKREVRGDDCAGGLVPSAEGLEEQLSARAAEGQVTDLVQYDQVPTGEAGQVAVELVLVLGGLQFSGQRGGSVEADAQAALAADDAKPRGNVRLSAAIEVPS